MKKKELIDAIRKECLAKDFAVPVQTIDMVLEALSTICASTLSAGAEVALPGLGVFKVKPRAERQGRNPATGASLTIPARNAPAFTFAKALKDAVG